MHTDYASTSKSIGTVFLSGCDVTVNVYGPASIHMCCQLSRACPLQRLLGSKGFLTSIPHINQTLPPSSGEPSEHCLLLLECQSESYLFGLISRNAGLHPPDHSE